MPAPNLTAAQAVVLSEAQALTTRARAADIRAGLVASIIDAELLLSGGRLQLHVSGPGRQERLVACPLAERAGQPWTLNDTEVTDWLRRTLVALGAQRDSLVVSKPVVRQAHERSGSPDNGPAAATATSTLATSLTSSVAAAGQANVAIGVVSV
jgi:hypothetical protein